MNEYIKYCLKHHISLEQFLLMYCISNDMFVELKDYLESVRHFEMKEMEDLLKKGLLISESKNPDVILVSDIKVNKNKFPFYTPDIDSWIGVWFDLFPKGIKTGGYLVRTDIRSCKKKMQQFMKDNPEFTSDIIIAATKNYIENMREHNFSHVKLAPYFISKDGMSTLHGYCDAVLNGTTETDKNDPFVINA